MQAITNFFRRILPTFFFIGYLPGMPGTWASLAVVAGLWYNMPHVAPYFLAAKAPLVFPLFAVFTMAAMAVCRGPKELFGAEDPKEVVLDEVVGQLITFAFIPLSITTLVFGFLLFRFYDIVKPWPVYRMEECGDGEGIVIDDLAAGIMANVTLVAIMFVYHLVKARISL